MARLCELWLVAGYRMRMELTVSAHVSNGFTACPGLTVYGGKGQ